MPLAPLLSSYDHVLLDLDGCVRVGEHVTPRATEAIAALRREGRDVAFVTNDPVLLPEEVVQQLWGLGIQASVREVVTVGGAVQHVCAEQPRWHTAYVVGPPAIHRHVQDAGLRIVDRAPADVVVVAAHGAFDYRELRRATRAVLAGADLLAAGRDATYPTPDGPAPGTGAVLAAIEYATGAAARSVGKPEPQLLLTALDRLETPPDLARVLVVGDRLDADVAGAAAAGLDAALVLTGVTGVEQGAAALRAGTPALVAVAPSLGALVLGD